MVAIPVRSEIFPFEAILGTLCTPMSTVLFILVSGQISLVNESLLTQVTVECWFFLYVPIPLGGRSPGASGNSKLLSI